MQRQLENQQICNDSYRTSADMQRQLGRLQIYCMYIVHVQLYIVPCTIWWSDLPLLVFIEIGYIAADQVYFQKIGKFGVARFHFIFNKLQRP